MLVLKDGIVLTPTSELRGVAVAIEDEHIAELAPIEELRIPPDATVISVNGAYIAPGFIDIHVNGGGGADAWHCTDRPDALETMCRTHARYGTTSLVPTLITAPLDTITAAVRVIAEARGQETGGADILGAHVEGPFISPGQKGAHNEQYIRSPATTDWSELGELSEAISIMTVAPELAGSCEMANVLASQGVVFSVGHSDAKLPDMKRAVDHGFSLVTHIFCSTPGYTRDIANARKISGVMESALILDELRVEIIGDGKHVPEGLTRLALKAKGLQGVCVVTDAINATGMGPGRYRLGDMDIVVEDNVAKLLDRSFFAGSVATMDLCVRSMVELGDLSIREAVQTATSIPAAIIGEQHRKGRIAPGLDGDVVVLDRDVNVLGTIVRGRPVYLDTERLSVRSPDKETM